MKIRLPLFHITAQVGKPEAKDAEGLVGFAVTADPLCLQALAPFE